jgi:predicted MFS family arabinose efflux permease
VGAALAGMGGWLAERYGWSQVFFWFGLAGVIYSLLLVFTLRDPDERTISSGSEPQPNFWSALQHLFSRGSYFLLLVYWGFIGLAGWAVTGWMPTYLEQQFHLSQGKAGLSATGYVYFAGLAGLVAGGWLADRWSRTHERGRIYVAVLGMCASSPGIFLAARSGWYWAAVSGLVLFGFSRSFTDSNTMPILCSVVDSRYRATGFGVLNFFANCIGGLTIYVGGWLRDAHVNVRHIFEAGGLGMLACAVLLFFVKPAAQSLVPAAESAAPSS